MGLFTKPEYRKIYCPFELDTYSDFEEEKEAGCLSIEACGNVDGQLKYFEATYSLKDLDLYHNGGYEEMLELLSHPEDKYVTVVLKYKKEKLKGFKIELESLVKEYDDERFMTLELLGWGIFDKSIKERVK